MAKRAGTRRLAPSRARPGGSASRDRSDPSDQILALRRKLGRLIGKGMASREVVARLLGSSPASVFNWEQGTAPSRYFLARIAELSRRADSGQINLSAARGDGGLSEDSALDARHRADSTAGAGHMPGRYANILTLTRNEGEIWLWFGLLRPGSSDAEPVAEVVVPTHLLEKLQASPTAQGKRAKASPRRR